MGRSFPAILRSERGKKGVAFVTFLIPIDFGTVGKS